MTLDAFRSLAGGAPVEALSGPLRALWHEARGDWDLAHRIVQGLDDRDAAWVHAYLHRREGDLGNAEYWYRRAARAVARDGLEAERERIAVTLLDAASP